MLRIARVWVLVLVALVPLALAQLSEEAERALERAEAAMQEALGTYERQYPDRPLWQEAIRAAREATELEPGAAEPLRLLAEIYSRSNWYGPAWTSWNAYLDAGNDLSSADAPLFVAVGNELGYTAYSRGDMDAALEYYQRVIEVVPYDKEAYVWAGRILLETGEPEASIPYWETVVERDATEERAQYFLQLARNQAEYGIDAANAFQEGVSLYEEGQLSAASGRFIQAARASESFSEAYAWAGRTLLESGHPERAIPYWEALLGRDETDARARYFLSLARDQAAWGPQAVTAFRAGVAAYEAGDLGEAAREFEAATEAQDGYAEAWAWRGRVAFEQEDYADAERYYQRASELQPENETYRYFYEEAQRRSAEG